MIRGTDFLIASLFVLDLCFIFTGPIYLHLTSSLREEFLLAIIWDSKARKEFGRLVVWNGELE